MDTLCRIVKRIEKLSRVYLHVVALFINFCLDQMCGTRVIFSGICMSCMSLTLWLMWAPSWRSGGLCLAPLSDLVFFHRGLACPTTFSLDGQVIQSDATSGELTAVLGHSCVTFCTLGGSEKNMLRSPRKPLSEVIDEDLYQQDISRRFIL